MTVATLPAVSTAGDTALPAHFMAKPVETDWAAPVVFGGIHFTLSQLAARVEERNQLNERFIRFPLLLVRLSLQEQGKGGCSPEQAISFLSRQAPEGENWRTILTRALTGQEDLGPMGWHAVLVASGVPRSVAQHVMHRRWEQRERAAA